jgi:hypothetical protein
LSPAVLRRIVLEIKQQRELLNVEARWAEHHKTSREPMVRDTFDRIGFWRAVLNDAERRLASS